MVFIFFGGAQAYADAAPQEPNQWNSCPLFVTNALSGKGISDADQLLDMCENESLKVILLSRLDAIEHYSDHLLELTNINEAEQDEVAIHLRELRDENVDVQAHLIPLLQGLRVSESHSLEIINYAVSTYGAESRSARGVELALHKLRASEFGNTWENLLQDYGGPSAEILPVFGSLKISQAAAAEAQADLAEAQADQAEAQADLAEAQATEEILRQAVSAIPSQFGE